jgi:hypothetical protein
MLVIEPWGRRIEPDGTRRSTFEPEPVIEHRQDSAQAVLSMPFRLASVGGFDLAVALRTSAIRRAFSRSMSTVIQSSRAVTQVIWRKLRVAGRALSASVGYVKAGYRFPVPRIPVRIGPGITQDMRRALAPFVCGVAVGIASVILLMPRVPSVMTFATRLGGAVPALDEVPSAAAKVPEAPIVLAAALPTAASAAAEFQPTTTAPRFRVDVRDAASPSAGRLPAAAPAAVPGNDLTAVGRPSSELKRADGNVPVQRRAASSRPAPVPQFLGSLAVSSSPPGAQVFVNGVSVGVTPLVMSRMPVGSRAVRVELDGHQRWSSAVRIVADERTLVAAKLVPSSTH